MKYKLTSSRRTENSDPFSPKTKTGQVLKSDISSKDEMMERERERKRKEILSRVFLKQVT